MRRRTYLVEALGEEERSGELLHDDSCGADAYEETQESQVVESRSA